jgi:DNA-binding transcriptional ArsR family regulator
MHTNYLRAMPSEWVHMSKVFEALGDEHRQRIVLTFEPGEKLTVGQLATVSTLSRPAVSHHLKILREANVLETQKVGKQVYYWINKVFLKAVFGDVTDYIELNV